MQRELTDWIEAAREAIAANIELQKDIAEVLGAEYVEDGLLNAVKGLCIYIAGGDGPINHSEADLINSICSSNDPLSYFEGIRKAFLNKPEFFDQLLASINAALIFNSEAQERVAGPGYRAESDNIVALVSSVGQLVVVADADSNKIELRCLGQITSFVHERSVAIEREIRSRKEKTSDSPGTQPQPTAISEDGDPMVQLHRLVGIQKVKVEIETLVNLAKVFGVRKQKNMPVPDMSFHLVFSGNPGTGKTTVARLIGKMYGRLGLLSKGHIIETDRAGLVAGYVGQTATKVRDVLLAAKGGVLFIDEAYSLSSGGENDFGREAIETLLKGMEDFRGDLVVIAAGYKDQMDGFLQSNPGLRSRFSRTIEFPDYSPEEMLKIFLMLAQEAGYQVDGAAMQSLNDALRHRKETSANFANARDARLLFEATIAAQANRICKLAEISHEALALIIRDDIMAAS